MSSKRVQITLPQVIFEKMEKMREETGLTKSALIALAIDTLHKERERGETEGK